VPFVPIFLVALAAIVAGNAIAFSRRRIAARFADGPEDTARLATTLTTTAFFGVFVVFSTIMSLFIGQQVLYAASGPVTIIFPVFLLLVFGGAYVQARYFPSGISRQMSASWRWGGAEEETPELWEAAFRARSWILALGVIPPLLVLLARLFAYGALGDQGDLPTDMRLD
jgi:hypothetical protein